MLVDGIERARFDPTRASHVRFQVEEGAELIEVRAAEDDDLLLAAHLIEGGEADRPKETAIVLEGGQKLLFRISPIVDLRGEPEGAKVDVAYRETQWRRAAALLLRQQAGAIGERLRLDRPVMKPAIAFAVLAALAIGLSFFWRSRKPLSSSDIANASPTPSVQTAQPSPTVAPVRREPRQPESPKPLMAKKPGQPRSITPGTPDQPVLPDNPPSEDPGLRTPRKRQEPASLSRVKEIHVDPFGPFDMTAATQTLRDAVVAALRAVPSLKMAASRDAADAVLKGTIVAEKPEGADQATLRVRIVLASGDVIWPANRQWKEYKGTADEVARKLANELRDDLEKAQRKER